MRAQRVVLTFALAAGSAHAAPRALPAQVAPLFERGRVWDYDISLTRWGGDGTEPAGKTPKVTSHDRVTCMVVAVAERPAAMLARIACSPDTYRKLRVAGWYAATAHGLWRLDTDAPGDDDLAAALKTPPWIAGAPRVMRTVTHGHGMDPKHDAVIDGVRRDGAAWCIYEDTTDADPDGGKTSTCFASGLGIASVTDDSGGELNQFTAIAHARSTR